MQTDTQTTMGTNNEGATPATALSVVKMEDALATEIVETAPVVDQSQVDSFISSLVGTKNTAEGPSLVISSFGSKEMKDIQVLSKVLNSPIKTLSDSNSPANAISNQLIDLKVKVDEINPGKFDLQPGFFGRAIQKITGNSAINKYVTKYQKTSDVIEAITRNLDEGSISLQETNHIFFDDKQRFIDTSAILKNKVAVLIEADTKLKEMIVLENDAEKKKFLQEEVLFVLEQHIQDLQQTMIVTQQGILALDILIKNNKELIKGVDRTKRVTIVALSVGATIATGLAQQKKVLDTVTAINQGTSDLLATNGALLKSQGAEIQKQASNAMLDIDKLTSAINDTISAIEDVEGFKQSALPQMSEAISKLSALSSHVDGKILKLEKGSQVKIES